MKRSKPTRKARKRFQTSVRARAAPSPGRDRRRGILLSLDTLTQRELRRLRLGPESLRWSCGPSVFPFRTTKEIAPLRGWLGQRKALRSLSLGLKVLSSGYNLFLCGLGGTDACSAVEKYVRSIRLPRREVPDRCYVQNFADPQRPMLLQLPAGRGARFRREIHGLLRRLHRALEKQPERKWRRRAEEILHKHMPAIQKDCSVSAVRRWLSAWKKSLLANVHHALIEDYEVNYLPVPRSFAAPVVVEKVPNPGNLFGWIGRRPLGEQPPVPHFTEIRGGSLLAADGGVLILSASDFYGNPSTWSMLKACLKYGVLQIEESDAQGGVRAGGLKPDPIPVNMKVVLIGDYVLYDHLFETDADFCDVFKVRVDFDTEVTLTSRLLKKDYPAFIARTCQENSLRPLTARGVARVVEFAMRKAGRKNKVTTQSSVVADLVREADYWAAIEGRSAVTADDVQRAVTENIERLNLVETKIAEMIHDGTIMITTSGSRVGQVNGLAVYDMGDYLFAKPSRITAETSYGQSGIINIERESGFSGRSHDKGIQILTGYLRSRFAQHRPLNLTASVCFEQSYSGVDGDSASATEIYAILSSLSRLPIRQDIAVTGSLNQKGDMQPIGGVNEKVQGFFDCVRAGRPTGREGVIIPRKNVKDLMLRDEVVRAVRRGNFHIFAVDTVEQGFELLTGVRAGRRHRNGRYQKGTSFALVDQRLEEIAAGLRHYQTSDETT